MLWAFDFWFFFCLLLGVMLPAEIILFSLSFSFNFIFTHNMECHVVFWCTAEVEWNSWHAMWAIVLLGRCFVRSRSSAVLLHVISPNGNNCLKKCGIKKEKGGRVGCWWRWKRGLSNHNSLQGWMYLVMYFVILESFICKFSKFDRQL